MFGLGGKNKSSQTRVLAANLQDEKRKFELIVNAIEDGVVLIDSQKVIRLLNPGASNISGWDPAEATDLTVNVVLKLVDA